MGGNWILGASIQLVGSVTTNLGTNLMKLGHDIQTADACAGTARPIYKYWQWGVGWLAFALGNAANFSSYAFASQALLTAVGSVQFVSNVLFSCWLLGESVRLRVLLATFVIIAGNVVLVVFASKSDPKYTADQLRRLYLTDEFSIYLTAAIGVGVPATYFLARYGLWRAHSSGRPSALWLRLTPVTYSVCSGLVGAQAVLFSTSLSILGRETLAGNNQLSSWFTAVLVLGLMVCAAFWVTRLNQGLCHFEASTIIPLLQIVWILLIMVSGNLYFREFFRFTELQLAMFLVGTSLLLLGIYCLTPSGTPADQQEQGGQQKGQQQPRLAGGGSTGGGGEQSPGEDATVAVQLLSGAKPSQAGSPGSSGQSTPRWSQQQQEQQRLLIPPALAQLDARALTQLPQKHLLAILQQVGALPRSEAEAVALEQALAQLAAQQQWEREQRQQQRQQLELSRQPRGLSRLDGKQQGQYASGPGPAPGHALRLPPHASLFENPLAGAGGRELQWEAQQWEGQQPGLGQPLSRPLQQLLHASSLGGMLPGRARPPARQQSISSNPLFDAGQSALGSPGQQQPAVPWPAVPEVLGLPTHAAGGSAAQAGLQSSWRPGALAQQPRRSPGAHLAAAPLQHAATAPQEHLGVLLGPPLQRQRSSFGKLTAAARSVGSSLRNSMIQAAELLAGMRELDRLQALSLLSVPMLATYRSVHPPTTMHPQRGMVQHPRS